MAKHILFPAILVYFFALNVHGQCPEIPTSDVIDNTLPLCEGSVLTMVATGLNLDIGSTVDWYVTEGTGDPYMGEGIFIGSSPVIGDPCENEPEILYIMVNPDNAQVGSSGDQCDEFIVMWTGSGGYLTSDILVSNLGPGSFQWDNYVAGNAANFSCGTALPPGPVPEDAILIIQSSPNNNVFINVDNLCASGLPVYIIAYDGTSACTGGYFDNDSPCASCPVMVDISGATCQYDFELNYMPPGTSLNGWAWANTGSGVYADVVPVLDIPVFMMDGIMVQDFVWTIPTNFCEDFPFENAFIVGIPNPPPPPGCIQITTPYYGIGVQCGSMVLSGGGEVCEGNCPEEPTEINFEVEGTGAPFIADIIVSASVFPPFEIEDLEISNGQSISVCLEGFFPSFDPSTGILNVPVLAIGITATVEIVSLTTSAGCPVTVNPSSISLTFIGAPNANAGVDQTICARETVSLSGSIGGTATEAEWTTDGDGTFNDPFDLDAVYTPGSEDIANGEVILTLTAVDANGTCIPATSDMVVTIEPSWTIEVGPPQTVCNTDVVNVMAVITGPPATGFWSTNGDGEFDDEEAESTFYIPGTGDLANGSVILFYNMDNNGPCTAPNEPLEVTFVYAPEVSLPSNIEVCTEDSVTIHIGLSGNFTQVNWTTLGDGTLIVLSDVEVNYTPGPGDINNQFVIISVTVISGFPQCGSTTYNLPVDIVFCDCPPFVTEPPEEPLCADSDQLDLSTLLASGGAGSWSITSFPPGLNPAVLIGNVFMTNGSDPGFYTVTYTLNAPDPGCPGTSSEIIEVRDLVAPFAGADMAFCGAQSVAVVGEITPALPVPVMWTTSGDGNFADPADLTTTYTPGPQDSVSAGIYLVLHVLDPVCGDQRDSVTLFFNVPPFATFPNDTVSICSSTANGSVLDFSSLIIAGDTSGTWTDLSGLPIDFSNPDSVDFNGMAEGYYLFQYQTNSAMSPCSETIYNIIVSVEDCACPLLIVQNVPEGICNNLASLPLDAFVMAGAPGSWQVISTPPGLNPATVSGSSLIINGCDPGLYGIRFTFDAAPIVGCPDSADIDVFIQEVMSLSVSGDTSACGQTLVQLNAVISGSAIGVNWTSTGLGSFTDPASLTTSYLPSATDVASAHVELIATATDTFGFCPVPSDTLSVFLVTPPSTRFSALTDTLCNHPDSGSVINLFSFIVEGDGTGFWTDLDASMVDLSDPTQVDFAGVSAGVYRILYTTQTALAPCTDSMYTFTVVVEDCSCPSLILSPDVLFLCQGNAADLNDQLIAAAPGSWSITNGPFGIWPEISGSTITTNDAAGGNYVLVYTLTDSVAGCPASATATLNLEAPPTFAVLDLICDAQQLFYEILIQSDAVSLSPDFGIVTMPAAGQYSITGVPAGQDVEIIAAGLTGLCDWVFNVTSPDCSCTLFTEEIEDTIRFCPGDTFVLIPIVTGAQGLPFSTWITPDGTKMQPTLPLYEEGEYIWIVRDMGGCEERDTFYVSFLGPEGADITTVSPTCPDDLDGQIIVQSILEGSPPFMLQLDAGTAVMVSQFPYVFTNVGLGPHVITVTDVIGCSLDFDASVENGEFGTLDLGPDVVIQKGDSTLIQPSADGIEVLSVIWDPALPQQDLSSFWFSPETTLLLSAIVQDSAGCFYTDELLITVLEKETFYIPNVFTPNGDQINDEIIVITNLPEDRLISLEIYDRWGSLLYGQYSNPPYHWDGNVGDEEAQSGVYIYKLIWNDISGNHQVRIGDITLLR